MSRSCFASGSILKICNRLLPYRGQVYENKNTKKQPATGCSIISGPCAAPHNGIDGQRAVEV